MTSGLLASILSATAAEELEERSRLTRFFDSHSWPESLVAWFELEAGEDLPTRRDIARRISLDIAHIDELISAQLSAILHHPALQKLEASWRGLRNLTEQVDDGARITVRVLHCTWRELSRDLDRAMEFDQSQIFKRVYSDEFDTPGGHPFGVLLGDYFVSHRAAPGDPVTGADTLRAMSQVAAAAFSPFIASADPHLFGLDHMTDLERPIDLERVFQSPEYVQWNSFRDTEDARFVGLTLPRVLMREPYVDDPLRADGFRFQEDASDPERSGHLWGSAVYAFGSVLTRAFAECGWLAGIRGVSRDTEGGGLVTGLPTAHFATDTWGVAPKPSTEVVITDNREKELSDLGFIPLCHCHGTSLSAFYANQSVQRPPVFDSEEATVNGKLSSMLQYMFCVSRFAHYIKVLVRDRVGSYATAGELERYLSDWLLQYVTGNEDVSSEMQAQFPLREAQVQVRERPGSAGVYLSTIHLRPHFQLDQMTTAVKLTTQLTEYEL